MVRGADYEDAVVVLEAVEFVEEVGADIGGDNRVEILEDKLLSWLVVLLDIGADGTYVAGCVAAGLVEDLCQGIFWAGEARDTVSRLSGDADRDLGRAT